MDSECISCGSAISPERMRRHARYCTNACQASATRNRYEAANPTCNLPPASTGTLAELAVASDLLLRGFTVFRNMAPNGPCDLIVLRDDKLLRVEVTSGTWNRNKTKFFYPPHRNHRYDVLAVWLKDGSIHYDPEP